VVVSRVIVVVVSRVMVVVVSRVVIRVMVDWDLIGLRVVDLV
jgi:hypothetical protein